MLAAIQAPIIMMSQNRQDKKDRLRSELDFDVNRRAESEIQGLAHKIIYRRQDRRRRGPASQAAPRQNAGHVIDQNYFTASAVFSAPFSHRGCLFGAFLTTCPVFLAAPSVASSSCRRLSRGMTGFLRRSLGRMASIFGGVFVASAVFQRLLRCWPVFFAAVLVACRCPCSILDVAAAP